VAREAVCMRPLIGANQKLFSSLLIKELMLIQKDFTTSLLSIGPFTQ